MTILYFASIRERVGRDSEQLTLPDGVKTISDLVEHLGKSDDALADAMAERFFVRIAVNQIHADWDSDIKDGDEIAFFPPITGG